MTTEFDRKKYIEDKILFVIGRPQDDTIKSIIDQYTKNVLCKMANVNDENLQVCLGTWKGGTGIIGLCKCFSEL